MRFVRFLSTLLLILTITGSQFVTTLASQFISLESASQIVTIPYRAFVLFIALLIILITIKKNVKLDKVNKLLYFYWGLLILRFIYDIYFRIDISVDSSRINQFWLLFIGSTLIPMFAITKSYQYVNLKWVFNGAYFLSIVTGILIINSVEGYIDIDEIGGQGQRLESNVAMGTIITGYFGLLLLIMSFYSFMISKNIFVKLFNLSIIVVGILLLFRSGSRGPIFAAVSIALFYLIAKRTSPFMTLFTVIILCLVFSYWDYILISVSKFAPNLYVRFTREEGLLWDRIPIYNMAIDSFLKNPLIGHDFAIYSRGIGGMSYAHNIFLDTLMQLGLIGITIMGYIIVSVLKITANSFKTGNSFVWLSLFLLMKFFMLQLSSAFYLESSFSIIIVFMFQQRLIDQENNKTML